MPDPYPIPKFFFKVKLPGIEGAFTEVSGLEAETAVIEYREGSDATFFPKKLPGLKKTSNVTLKKGIFKGDISMFTKFNDNNPNKPKRDVVSIFLLSEDSDTPAMKWTLEDAWPTKITGTDLKSDANEVSVESMELACERLLVAES